MSHPSMERPLSAGLIRDGGRQRLRHPSLRRNQVVNSTPNINLEKHNPVVSTISSTDKESSISNDKDKSNEQEDLPIMSPLKKIMPKKTPNGPIEVYIRCVFLRVGEINTLNERYHAELFLEASWKEQSFKGLQTRPFEPSVNWTPELELINGIGELQDDVTYSVRHDKQGVAIVTEHHRLKGTLWERMELQHFPIDVQELSVSITSSRTDSDMIFVENRSKPSGVNRNVFTDEQEWHLFEHVDIQVSQQIDEFLDAGHNHSLVICSCHAARKYGYFLWNAYFLIFLITSASFTTFPIPLSNIHGRVQIACTLLLTSITFRWLCNKSLPTISYLTAVDVYAIGSIFSLCLLNIYHGVIGYINYYQSGNATGATSSVPKLIVADRWALVVFTILFFAYQTGTLIWIYLVPWKKRRIMFEKDKQNRRRFASIAQTPKPAFINGL